MPNDRRRTSVISSSVRPPTSTSALGLLLVSGRRRVPSPAAKIIAFIWRSSPPSLRRSPPSLPHRFGYRRLKPRRLKPQVPHFHFDSTPPAQTLRELFGQKHRPVLPARAPKRHHQILESAFLIIRYAGVHQRKNTRQILMHAFLLVQVLDHRHIFPGQLFEAFFASGIRQTSSVKNKPSAVP